MTELSFILSLHEKLSDLPRDEVEERLNFYREMIEDRIEEGYTEEEAVAAVGTVAEIAAQIAAEIPSGKPAKKNLPTRKRRKSWEIVLLALGSPVWLSLLLSACAVVFSLYISLWAVVISFWAVWISLVACWFGGMVASVVLAIRGNRIGAVFLLGAALVCAGLSIFLYYGCKAATKGIARLTKKLAQGIKRWFTGKEAA